MNNSCFTKKVFAVLVAFMLFLLPACSTSIDKVNDHTETSMFVEVEVTEYWRIVCHKETKVMYAVSCGVSFGVFTLLVNADGSPMIYNGGW